MMNQFSPKVSEILSFSREEAERLTSRSVTPEHIMLALLREKTGPVWELFNQWKVDIDSLKKEIEKKIREQTTDTAVPVPDMLLNEQANNILKLAVLEARLQHAQTVDTPHLLLAILHDSSDNGAKKVLEDSGINYNNTVSMLQQCTSQTKNGIGMADEDEMDEDMVSSSPSSGSGSTMTTQASRTKSKTPVIDSFGTDLTVAAAEGKLDPVVGREKEIMRVCEILGRRKKNNPILIGEPGVGKSAIVEGLAQLIVKHLTSPILFDKRVITLDLTAVVAGTKYRGQFEERIRALIKEIEQNPDIIIFIDEIHTLIGAGSSPGSMDAANILKPALARGTIQCIGATTLDEYRNSIEKDGALERRFQKVQVEPTTVDKTLQILENIKDRYEAHHHVVYTDDALKACVKYADRYITDRFFPDKAIDIIDEAGSRVHLQHVKIPQAILDIQKEIETTQEKKQAAVKNQNFELAASFRDRQTELEQTLKNEQEKWQKGDADEKVEISEEDIAGVVSMMTGVPVQRMQEAEGVRLKNMDAELKRVVIAQDAAIDKMVKAIQRNRVGLKDPNHPIGAFMFLGPTGVGKTYLAKRLAEMMFGSSDALIRIDMSEYTESFNTSRLVGAPPGYVGYEEGGQLTEKVRHHPYSIVLLDEIEKAHGNVFNMLLQVLDEGRLTDGNGRLIDFRNTVIIMTSNAGTRQLKEFGQGIGFKATGLNGLSQSEGDKQRARSIIQKSLSKQFAPEFLNRLDEIVTFDQLDLDAIKKIINIELKGLFRRVHELGYKMEITDEAKEFVAIKGYDVQFGARPLKRAIQNYIEDGLCELILSGNIKTADTIVISKEKDRNRLTFDTVSQSEEQGLHHIAE
ncbi:ATP-dependent Clp protease ATP-binding subunit [Prevotella denticola]|uniref:ATP-dependent Clp protease ATP-binding subunit n=1 Tax=Prevotella denticola TaxID=28129 RepID=UPI000201268F|nr:ATP-dependent Clp protease ATP-binding subunit [Prevotella denticola]AEA21663.1 ATPase family associated with various cellular activities (AAA) [Prevotella denticola F0289]QUB89800.1 ATP-dependent Clp protease ATP-binding subunit [Prevotella denticola]